MMVSSWATDGQILPCLSPHAATKLQAPCRTVSASGRIMQDQVTRPKNCAENVATAPPAPQELGYGGAQSPDVAGLQAEASATPHAEAREIRAPRGRADLVDRAPAFPEPGRELLHNAIDRLSVGAEGRGVVGAGGDPDSGGMSNVNPRLPV